MTIFFVVAGRVCKHYKPKHTSHFRTRDFSCVAQDLSHRVNRNRCVSQNSHSSHLAQHVARALVGVPFTREHCHTLPHFRPTSYPTIYQTFIDVYFTHRLFLRRSIECVFRPWLKCTRLHFGVSEPLDGSPDGFENEAGWVASNDEPEPQDDTS